MAFHVWLFVAVFIVRERKKVLLRKRRIHFPGELALI